MQTTNLKQQQLTFDKGITNVPSDAICSDNTLEESIGLVYENGDYYILDWEEFLDGSYLEKFENVPYSLDWYYDTDALDKGD